MTVDQPHYKTSDEVDFVIVGSGAAGGILAKELSTNGFRVVVLEQGRVAMCHAFHLSYKTRVNPLFPYGIYTVPALGGPERKLASTTCLIFWDGGRPIWTPDGRCLLLADVCRPGGPRGDQQPAARCVHRRRPRGAHQHHWRPRPDADRGR